MDWDFGGFRQGHSSSGRWREGRAVHTCNTGEEERERTRQGGREGKTDLLLWVLYLKCLADMLSDSEVRGDDCIDRFYSPIITEKETESRLEQRKLVMHEKHHKSPLSVLR